MDIKEKPLKEATNPKNTRKRKKHEGHGQNKPFKSSHEMDEIDSPAVKVKKEVKLEIKEKTLDVKKEIDDQLQTEEPLNNKVEYLYSYDDPKTWKPCGKCSICQKALGQEDTLKTDMAFMKEKKAQDQATKQGGQKLKTFKTSEMGSGVEINNNELQTDEASNNKVEYLYSFDNPKNWKPCMKCSICEKTFGLKVSLEKHDAAVHEGKKAQDQAKKQGLQKLEALKSSKKGS